jgi:hypothetical protein
MAFSFHHAVSVMFIIPDTPPQSVSQKLKNTGSQAAKQDGHLVFYDKQERINPSALMKFVSTQWANFKVATPATISATPRYLANEAGSP